MRSLDEVISSLMDGLKEPQDFTGLLQEVSRKMGELAFDACQVIEMKTGKKVSEDVIDTFLSLPYIVKYMEKEIEKEEGSLRCSEKTFFMLNEDVKRGLYVLA